MATSAYLTGRKRYSRPQSILWANNAGTLSNGLYVPNGIEVGATTEETDPDMPKSGVVQPTCSSAGFPAPDVPIRR